MSQKLKYKSKFQDAWLRNQKYNIWLEKVADDEHSARCKVCCKVFSVAGQGVKALDTHATGKKHQQKIPVDTESAISFGMSQQSESPESSQSSSVSTSSSSAPKQTSIVALTDDNLAKEAEIIFATDVIL